MRRERNRSCYKLWAVLLLVFCLPFIAACSGGGGTTSGGATEPAAVNLSGTFSGPASDSSASGQMTLKLTQTGSAVNGSMGATLTNGCTMSGNVSGTLSGTNLSFNAVVPQGGVSCQPGCSINFTGTATATNTSITGTYGGTNSCFGPFSGGKFALTKS
jgi:hypothetical protein